MDAANAIDPSQCLANRKKISSYPEENSKNAFLSVWPPSLKFTFSAGNLKVQEKAIEITNYFSKLCPVQAHPFESNYFRVGGASQRRWLSPGSVLRINVLFYPDESRDYNDVLSIRYLDDRMLRIKITAKIRSHFSFPTNVNFGNVPLGRAACCKIPISSCAEKKFSFAVLPAKDEPCVDIYPRCGHVKPGQKPVILVIIYRPLRYISMNFQIRIFISNLCKTPHVVNFHAYTRPGLLRESLENVEPRTKRTTQPVKIIPLSRKKRKPISQETPKFLIKKPAKPCTSFEKALAKECCYFPLYALHTVNCVLNSKIRKPYGEHELKGPLNAYVYQIVEQKARKLKEFLLKVQSYREANERARIHHRPKVNYGTRDASEIEVIEVQIQREQEWNDYRESAMKTSMDEDLFQREKARGIKQRILRASQKASVYGRESRDRTIRIPFGESHAVQMDLTFNCNGKVNSNDWELSKECLFLRGEVENVLYPQDESRSLSDMDVQLFDCAVPAATAVLDLKHFIKCLDVQLKILGRHETCKQVSYSRTDDIDFYHIRRIICEFILYIRTYLNSIKWDLESLQVINKDIEEDFNTLFVTIKRFLRRLRNIPDATFRYAPSKLGNQCKQPEYHMYHAHIELRWLFISLVYTRSMYYHYSVENQFDELENIQATIINDLICISSKIFETMPLIDIQQKTPYNCTCIRELWLMVQVFSDSLSEKTKSKTFWDYVNDCIDGLLSAPNGKQQSSRYTLGPCKNSELFCLWIVYHVSRLYGYNSDGTYLGSKCSRIRPNYEKVEKILKTYISKGGKDGERDEIDEELRTMIPLLDTTVIDWWQPRVSVISLLWDCFHKRLDEPFLLQTSGPWTLSVEKKTAVDILKQVRDRISNTECGKESSYGMFLRLLGSFLQINYSSSDTRHWNQIKGRIYSKFSKSKVQEFSVTGLYNFISLFLTLAVTADTTNVCSVLLDLLPVTKEYNNETSKKYNLIWKGKLAILLLHSELGLRFASIAPYYVDTVNAISCRKDDTSRSMMFNFIDVFSIIMSSSRAELGEHLLLGGWVDRYLLECSSKMVGTLTKALVDIFEKCTFLNLKASNSDGVGEMLDALWCYVACRVRQLVFDPARTGDHYRDVSKLAVEFTLEALRNPATAKKHKHSAVSLFQHFASSIIVKDIRITRRYLVLILEREQAVECLKREMKNFDTILVQAWIKCSIIGHDTNDGEIKIIQNYVLRSGEIQEMFATARDIQEFQDSDNESILMFMMYSMKKRKTLKTEQERMQHDAKWRSYFNHLEKWILAPITEETKDSELSLWVYRCIGTLILCTSPMLYSKNQPNNMFKTLLNKTILSLDHPFLKNLGKKTFSMILLGIEALNVKSDISLQILIRDLFDRYMSLLITSTGNTNNFKVSDSLLKCFRDAKPDFLCLVFEILMSNFFSISSDNMMHKHSYLVMIFLQSLLKGERNYACYVTEYIISICTPYIIGGYMKVHDHHPHKQHTVDFINSVVKNSYYKENRTLQEKFNNVVSGIIGKSLITNQHNTFEFLRSVLSVRAEIVQFLSSQIERTLTELERNRRPNAASLRYSWNQLECAMKNVKGDQ